MSGNLIQTQSWAKTNLALVTLSDGQDKEHTIVFLMQIPQSVGALRDFGYWYLVLVFLTAKLNYLLSQLLPLTLQR